VISDQFAGLQYTDFRKPKVTDFRLWNIPEQSPKVRVRYGVERVLCKFGFFQWHAMKKLTSSLSSSSTRGESRSDDCRGPTRRRERGGYLSSDVAANGGINGIVKNFCGRQALSRLCCPIDSILNGRGATCLVDRDDCDIFRRRSPGVGKDKASVSHAHEWCRAIRCTCQIIGENSYLQSRRPVGFCVTTRILALLLLLKKRSMLTEIRHFISQIWPHDSHPYPR
jgi:hypothetical protein